jgi:zeaxanthin glucosyltransferase
MTHFGILCPTASGHINSVLPLGQELQKRGHRVTCFLTLDGEEVIKASGLDFVAIAPDKYPKGTSRQILAEIGQLSGTAAVKRTVRSVVDSTETAFEYLPDQFRRLGIDAVIVDQVSAGGGTIAERLDIPFISFCSALVLNRDPTIPPFMTTWDYNPSFFGVLRNRLGYKLLDSLTRPLNETIDRYRQRWGLTAYTSINQRYSPLAQISQQPAEFEFPRQNLPPHFHFTGPFHFSGSRQEIPFPYEKLTGDPLIYASMGTIQNRQRSIFETIASACADLPVQLVLSLGNSESTVTNFAGNPLIVAYAPQLDLLRRATLTITHAGLNTTLESLANGVPLVAIPITNDQPGVSARIRWSGVGEVVPLKSLTVSRLKEAIQKVLTVENYRENARRLQQAIQNSGGVTLAADIVEKAVTTGQPVLKLR